LLLKQNVEEREPEGEVFVGAKAMLMIRKLNSISD
jgi:hypothetical protein